MPILFNRKIQLKVFTADSAYEHGENLHIDFIVRLGLESTPNELTCTVYNLSEETRGIFSDKGKSVELYAGYGDDIELIFVGNIIDVQHRHQDVDWVTTIQAGDGQKEFMESKVNISYAKGTPVINIFNDIAGKFGLPVEMDFADMSLKLVRGRTYTGKVKDVLDKLTRKFGFTWSIQNQIIEVIKRDKPPLKDLEVSIISADTGLLESPILVTKDATKPKANKIDIKFGLEIRTLLNHRLRPARLFQLVPVSISSAVGQDLNEKGLKIPEIKETGIYRCTKVIHAGNNFGDYFETFVESDIV